MEPTTPHAFVNEVISRRIAGDTYKHAHARMRRALARQCDVDIRTLERYLSGSIDLRSQTIFALVNALKLSQEELNQLLDLYKKQANKALISRKPIRRKP